MISGEWCEHASKNLQTKIGESEYTDLHKAQDACAANQGSCFDQVIVKSFSTCFTGFSKCIPGEKSKKLEIYQKLFVTLRPIIFQAYKDHTLSLYWCDEGGT